MDKASVWRQQQQQASGGGGAAGNAVVAAASAASPACRPTGARWTPTQEQVTILKELYYGCGIRSPNAEQIQRIAARLRQFGKIEGKNVFYWFQNHKARERHKKRLAVDTSSGPDAAAHPLGGALSPSTPAGSGTGAAASSGGFYGGCNGRGGSDMQMDASTTTTCWGDSNSTWTAGAAAAPTSSGSFFGATGNGGRVSAVPMDGSTATTTCWVDSAAGIGATADRSFVQLQDYMGVTRSTGTGAAAQTRWPACFSFSADQTPPPPPTTTREPETLPLFPTGGQRSYLQPNSSFHRWGAAATTTPATPNTMTFQQQQQHHQLQEQHFYSSSSNQLQPMMMPGQDAGASLELTLSYPAGHM